VLAISLLDQLSNSLVIGVITGAVYSLVALGIVLVYKASGVFNFAQGEFGSVAVYAMYWAVTYHDLPYAVAIVLGLLAAVAVGLVTERLVIRPLFEAPRVTLLVATAGVALLSIGFAFWQTNESLLRSLPTFSDERARITVLGIEVSDQRLLIITVLIGVAVALAAFFRSPTGLAVLAASQEPTAAELVGISVRRVSSMTWGLAALLGGLAGVLSVPAIGTFGPGVMTFGGAAALIPGFTAAVIGGMTSLPGAAIGGLMVGIIESLGGLSVFDGLPGSRAVLVFVFLVTVLLVRPQGLLGARSAA
jgi:branched-chain amino acid transport system permease protein